MLFGRQFRLKYLFIRAAADREGEKEVRSDSQPLSHIRISLLSINGATFVMPTREKKKVSFMMIVAECSLTRFIKIVSKTTALRRFWA